MNTRPGIEKIHAFRSRILDIAVIDGFLFALTERGLYRKDRTSNRFRKIKAVGLESSG